MAWEVAKLRQKVGTPRKPTKPKEKKTQDAQTYTGPQAHDRWGDWARAKSIPFENIPVVKPGTIAWMENRLRDQESADTYQKAMVPEAVDIKAWLARERDGKSWAQIAAKLYPQETGDTRRKARHASERAWRYLIHGKGHPTGSELPWKEMMNSWKAQFVPGYWD